MSTITLTAGDFGADGSATFGEENLYLPDPARPGLTEAVRLADVTDMEAVGSDRSDQMKDALKLGAKGLMTAGPVGIAAGLLAARKPRDVVFTVALADGRSLTAVADAATYADLHTAQVAARAAALREDGPHPADEVIARYVAALQGDDAAPPVDATPVDDFASSEPSAPDETESAAPAPVAQRPVFGKRKRSA